MAQEGGLLGTIGCRAEFLGPVLARERGPTAPTEQPHEGVGRGRLFSTGLGRRLGAAGSPRRSAWSATLAFVGNLGLGRGLPRLLSAQRQSQGPMEIGQEQAWDAAAEAYAKWWPTFERAAHPVSIRLCDLARLGPGQRVLDVATGIGEPALTAARRVMPGGLVLAVDRSPRMIAQARMRAAEAGVLNVEFRCARAESLTAGPGEFDAALCRWGLGFVSDLNALLASVYRRLGAGRLFAAALWGAPHKVPLMSLASVAVRRLTSAVPRPPYRLDSFRLSDMETLMRALERAGFVMESVESMAITFEFDAPRTFADFRIGISPSLHAFLAPQPEQAREDLAQALAEAARPLAASDGRLRLVNEVFCLAARKRRGFAIS